MFAVSHPPGFLEALILVAAFERPIHCVLPKASVRGPLTRLLARSLGIIFWKDERTPAERDLRAESKVLAGRGTLVMFADRSPAPQGACDTAVSTAASVLWEAESQLSGLQVTIHAVHLFLAVPPSKSRESLIYVDSALARPPGLDDDELQALDSALGARFRENVFQLRPPDLEYFLGDLEELLRAGLQEDWRSRPNWKQEAEGFGLGRFVAEWVRQANYMHPGRLVSLRESLDEYRRLQQQIALRQLEVEAADSWLHSGLRRVLVWSETLVGLPIALFGLLNHVLIGALLLVAGSFKKNSQRTRSTEWMVRGVVVPGCYAFQILLVAHWWGRAGAGYYAPALLASGAYLWRYWWLARHQTRLLFMSLGIPSLASKAQGLRRALLEELDKALAAYEENAAVPQ
jgi:hypothetical protein